MITLEQILALNPVQITKGTEYSPVLRADEATYSLKSKKGKEFIYYRGEIFHHSDGLNRKVENVPYMKESVLTRVIDGKEINTIVMVHDEEKGAFEKVTEHQDFFVREMVQDIDILTALLLN